MTASSEGRHSLSLCLYCSQITLMDMDLAGIHIHWCLYGVTLTAMELHLQAGI